MVFSNVLGLSSIPDCNSRAFDNLRQAKGLHQEIILQTDKEFKGVDHDPL
jgi:hypothetical protein